jgi:hypothetical protein
MRLKMKGLMVRPACGAAVKTTRGRGRERTKKKKEEKELPPRKYSHGRIGVGV